MEEFLGAHAADIRGRVLEIGDADYTRKFGGARVTAIDVLNVDDGDPRTLAESHEAGIWWDDPADAPDRGSQLYPSMAPIVKAAYHVRGGRHPELPGRSTLASSGRVDLRFAVDRSGELYVLSKSDGMIRIVTGVGPPLTASRDHQHAR